MKDHAPMPTHKQLDSQLSDRCVAIVDTHAGSPECVERTSLGCAALLLPRCADSQWTWSGAELHSCQVAAQKLSTRRLRQLYLVTFFLRNGEKAEAIAERDESPIDEESGLAVYVVSKVLQPDGKPVPPRQ